MKVYKMTAQFVIGNDEDIISVADAWLKETVKEYETPTRMFDIEEIVRVRRVNDVVK